MRDDLHMNHAQLADFVRGVVSDEFSYRDSQANQKIRSVTKFDLSLDGFKKEIQNELGVVLRVWAPANIRTFVQQKVESAAFDVVMAAIGIEKDSWGKWSIKNKNNTNEIMQPIMDAARETIQEWFEHQLGNLPELPETAKKSILKEYREVYESELRSLMRDHAKRQAQQAVQNMIKEINAEPSNS